MKLIYGKFTFLVSVGFDALPSYLFLITTAFSAQRKQQKPTDYQLQSTGADYDEKQKAAGTPP